MSKIRVQDLARMMGIPDQELVFKLKSIGVRVEGDSAELDTEVIQAILQGKRLPSPREVILRDRGGAPVTETEKKPAARAPAARPRRTETPAKPAGRRPQRRSMIQRVGTDIRNLEVARPRRSEIVRQEAEAKRKAEEEAKRKAEEEALRQAEEEAKRKAEAEAKRKAEEEARRQAEEEAKKKAAAETAKKKAEEEAKKKAAAT
ncbi:MAG: translation initiation factor IF-2 N-terminal domain-containing protein, partial [Acidobacteriota bacterium]